MVATERPEAQLASPAHWAVALVPQSVMRNPLNLSKPQTLSLPKDSGPGFHSGKAWSFRSHPHKATHGALIPSCPYSHSSNLSFFYEFQSHIFLRGPLCQTRPGIIKHHSEFQGQSRCLGRDKRLQARPLSSQYRVMELPGSSA